MKIFFFSPGLFLIALLGAAPAQEVPAPAPLPFKPYRASTKSSFVTPESGRNPFWPVGFMARPQAEPNEEPLLRIPVEQYKVSSIILDAPSIAVINGKDYTRGQFLTMSTGGGTIKLLITNIEDGVVTVQYKDMIAKIPITRK